MKCKWQICRNWKCVQVQHGMHRTDGFKNMSFSKINHVILTCIWAKLHPLRSMQNYGKKPVFDPFQFPCAYIIDYNVSTHCRTNCLLEKPVIIVRCQTTWVVQAWKTPAPRAARRTSSATWRKQRCIFLIFSYFHGWPRGLGGLEKLSDSVAIFTAGRTNAR